jgi:chemotaxis protein methyltransferase CheR
MSTATLLNSSDFDYIRNLVHSRSAIVLEPEKMYLIDARLTPVARQHGLNSLSEMIQHLRECPANALHQQVVEAMTTNETSFFRDLHPFETLRQTLLPELIAKRAAHKSLGIWSAACSSGQEPYTIAMLLREHSTPLTNWNVRLIATDLATKTLSRAREGMYNQSEVNRGLPAPLLVKYFQKQGQNWQIKEDIRRMVQFTELNLVGEWPSMPPLDIVFLRNVLIYFSTDTKKLILKKVRQVLRPDGYLFLGAAETTLNLDDAFERVQLGKTICYRLVQK